MLISLGIGAIVALVSLVLRLAAFFRLTIPLLYALLAPTLLSKWFYANYDLAYYIGYALVGLTALSWIISLIRKIQEIRADRLEEQLSMDILRRRIRESDDVDEYGYRIVSVEGLFR
jgi:hypothetical protein